MWKGEFNFDFSLMNYKKIISDNSVGTSGIANERAGKWDGGDDDVSDG